MRPEKLPGLFLFFVLTLTAFADEQYRILQKIPIPGDYGWDYLAIDEGTRRLYVSHDSEVIVIDVDSHAIVGKISELRGVHGIAIVPALHRGFITNGTPGSVTIFDTKSLKKIDEVKVGESPNCVLFDPATGHIFTADRGSQRVTAIDAKTGRIAGTIEHMGGKVEFAVADGKGHVFINMQDRGTVVKLDSLNLKVMETWPLSPCGLPTSIAMDRQKSRLFIGCRSGVMAVVDSTSGHVVTTLPIGMNVDATAYDEKLGLAFFSNGDGTLTIVRQKSTSQYEVIQNVKTEVGARTVALDPRTHKLFLAAAEYEHGPEPAPGMPRRRGKMVADSFHVLVAGK